MAPWPIAIAISGFHSCFGQKAKGNTTSPAQVGRKEVILPHRPRRKLDLSSGVFPTSNTSGDGTKLSPLAETHRLRQVKKLIPATMRSG
jgi:hypothetical protein